MVEFTHSKQNGGLVELQAPHGRELSPISVLKVNGLANAHGGGVGMILKSSDDTVIEQSL